MSNASTNIVGVSHIDLQTEIAYGSATVGFIYANHSRPHRAAFVIYGDCMSVAMADADLTMIDEALRHMSLVAQAERGPAWYAYLDALLEARAKMED